ncbi:hypothetical protein [Shewanella sp. CG12_big_fil_rev_8_21_14_0_65_47_15]|uniref:hypothetical protein n=1 Tax=Shewanella sp. CG12_big_fil_rev_8_21_14_0_65_47_15 TaxID=1975537 RepID=UPI0025F7C19E|nr:hypothetical protein [Shewanella sp. CG12_big_fil_rev_8_21_14_0_65_47_15]
MNSNKKLFAFKLAEKKQLSNVSSQKNDQFKAREGVAIAGCTDPTGRGLVRFSDTGMYC